MENDSSEVNKMKSKKETGNISLDDVTPLHPDDYPAKHLKEKLDGRREELDEIENRAHPSGLPEGPGGF
jgi:hypothetical protein